MSFWICDDCGAIPGLTFSCMCKRKPPPPPCAPPGGLKSREVESGVIKSPPHPPDVKLIKSSIWANPADFKKEEKKLTTEEKLAYAIATLEAIKSLSTAAVHINILDKALKTLKEN